MKLNPTLKFKDVATVFIFLLAVVAFVMIIALLPRVFSSHEFLFQIIAVVLSVAFTAIVTNSLLIGQSSAEEDRERNIKVYENKVQVYSEFVSKMWGTISDNIVDEGEIKDIRAEVFNKLIFYLDSERIKKISDEFAKLSYDAATDKFVEAFRNITTILRSDIIKTDDKKEKQDGQEIIQLWSSFNKMQYHDDTVEEEVIEKDGTMNPIQTQTGSHVQTYIHFNMWGKEYQYGLFAKGINALFLCEYSEVKRTNRLKRTSLDEIVFLYQSGGPGYVGAFLVKGWVVFTSNGNGKLLKKEECNYEKSKEIVTIEDESTLSKDIALYELDWFLNDGCTLMSYLLVEPLAYYENGVGRISLYRTTISSYYGEYGRQTLSRLIAAIKEEGVNETYHVNDNILTLQCNKEALNDIIKREAITPAEKAPNGNWI